MFWKFNNASSSQIEAVLAKEDVTLQELMEEDDIINECKLQNKALMDFLVKPEIIEELVTLTTVEPSAELDERSRFKYPNIACEILTCDVSALNERLASDEALLSKLYMFLDSELQLNPLLASFFSKIMGVLITKKTEQVLDFLKAKDNFVPLLLKHLGTSAIMDLTLKLMTQVEGVEVRQNILNWLDSQRIMQSLVSLLDPEIDTERHYHVAQLLCDFIKISRDYQRNSTERNDPDPLLNTLESPETVSLLLEHMLKPDKCETCIVGGIQVLLSLLDVTKSSNPEEVNEAEQKQSNGENILLAILRRLKDLHGILLDPPTKSAINTTIGVLDPPLGNTRIQVTKLFACIISTNNPEILKEIMSLGTIQVLLDLFFKFPWNNFLHTQVEACICSALKAHIPTEAGDNALYTHVLVNCKLVERILEAWQVNETLQSQNNGVRQGYMGHLTNIANNVGQLCASDTVGQFMKVNLPEINESFEKFQESVLSETNKTREILLGGAYPHTSNEESDDYGEMPYSQSNLLHQSMFAQYQSQQLTPEFIEAYGFSDDELNDGYDTLQTMDHRTGMNFDLAEDNMAQQHNVFKQICAQNFNTYGDADDQIFEERDHTFQTVIEHPGERHATVYSSDSDDDESPPADDPFMDVDPWNSPNGESESAVAPITAEDPWFGVEKTASANPRSWASFSSPSFANFEANFQQSPEQKSAALAETPNKAVLEMDLTIENMDVESKKVDDFKNQNSNESIENVAQAHVKRAEESLVVAAGDQPQASSIKETCPDVSLPSINTSSIGGDSCSLQVGATVCSTNPEPDKEGV